LYECDPDGTWALVDEIGMKRLRNPQEQLGCESARLIMLRSYMVGDRPFTDIVYKNRKGSFTILTEPLSLAEEPLMVRQANEVD
ncbi:hypothetical protein Sango_3033600, partial [Sesamum angolense]